MAERLRNGNDPKPDLGNASVGLFSYISWLYPPRFFNWRKTDEWKKWKQKYRQKESNI